MPSIPDSELKEVKDSVNIVDVVSKFTELKRHGKYYEGLCPFHSDETVGSFKVNAAKGTYKCYSCGVNGDSISFLTNMGQTFKRAVEILKGNEEIVCGETITKTDVEHVNLADFSYIPLLYPIDYEVFEHNRYGSPTSIYEYRDEQGICIGYVLRYDYEGKKYIFPYNYGMCTKEGWEYEYRGEGKGKYFQIGDITHKYLGFGETKPIYNLDYIGRYPKANVVIVEGEKTADYVQSRFDPNKVIVLTWQSGTNSVDRVDWSVLKNRRCFLIPDNDWSHEDKLTGELKPYMEQPSPKAFNYITGELSKNNNEVTWVALDDPMDKLCGWDLADSGYSTEGIITFIKNHSKLQINFKSQ